VATGSQVHAYRVTDGVQAWTFPATVSNTTGVFVADPAVSDSVIIAGSEGPTNSYSGLLFGLDPANGSQLWCLAFDQKGVDRSGCPLAADAPAAGLFGLAPAVDNRIIGGLAVADGVAYVGLANGKFYAVDAATGHDLWHFNLPKRDVWAPPLVVSDTIYVTSLDHSVYALDVDTGNARWTKALDAAIAGTPTLSADGSQLYVGTFGSHLYTLDARTGEQVGEPLPANNWVWAGPTVAEGVLYFTDVGGYVHAVDAETHADVFAPVKPGGFMRAAPAVAGDTLYVGDRDGKLFGLDRHTGAVVYTAEMKGQLLAPIVVVNDTVLVAPFNGDNLLAGYSLDLKTARLAIAPVK
jgi:outer membrane protein assembly factor BamB